MTLKAVRAARGWRSQLVCGLLLWIALALTAWLYWPGTRGPLLLDDGVNLESLQSLDDARAYLGDVVSGNRAGPTGRPVSMLSFAAERLWIADGVRGLKRTNILLHLLCACLVAWLGARLLPALTPGAVPQAGALLALPWMLTPMFVSTTLYVVQRMAQLSTLFCLVGLICYCIGRQRLDRGARGGWLLCAMVLPATLLAVYSKEGGIVLLPLVLLLEAGVWKWRLDSSRTGERVLRFVHALLAACGVLLLPLYFAFAEHTFLNGFASRDFSLGERLLSEARALCDYAFRLLVPLREGLGVFHDDFAISRGVLEPPTTAISVLLVVAVSIIAGVRVLQTRCAVSLGALFFLGAHSAESTILPLELYFEHRNYLAGFGIYLAVAGVFAASTVRRAWLKPPLLMLTGVWLLWAAAGTGRQAATWSNELVLLLDAAETHPRSMRVNASLAAKFAEMRLLPEMLRYSDAAAALDEPQHPRHAARKLALYCIADSPLPEALLAEMAVGLTADALRDPAFSEAMQVFVTRLNRGLCPRLQGEPVAAAFRATVLGQGGESASPRMYGLLATLEIYIGQYQLGLQYLERWLQRDPGAVQAWMMQLHVATLTRQEALRMRALAELDRLDREGRISAEQRDDIALYR